MANIDLTAPANTRIANYTNTFKKNHDKSPDLLYRFKAFQPFQGNLYDFDHKDAKKISFTAETCLNLLLTGEADRSVLVNGQTLPFKWKLNDGFYFLADYICLFQQTRKAQNQEFIRGGLVLCTLPFYNWLNDLLINDILVPNESATELVKLNREMLINNIKLAITNFMPALYLTHSLAFLCLKNDLPQDVIKRIFLFY